MFTLGLVLAIAALAQPGVPLRIDSVVPHAEYPRPPTRPLSGLMTSTDRRKRTRRAREGGLDERNISFGGAGRSMICLYSRGKQGIGNRKVFFGDSPTGRVVRKGEVFEDVFWRVYVKHQPGWSGGGEAKFYPHHVDRLAAVGTGDDRPRLVERGEL